MIVNNRDLAYQKKLSLNHENQFNLKELLSMPKFFDFIDCFVNNKDKFFMFLADADDAVALRFFWNGFYEKTTLNKWFNLSKETNGVILDVGAHTGSYSLAALLANNLVEVISFEPHFMNFSRLLLNIKANQFKNSLSFMMCVGDENKSVPFSVSTDINYLSTGGSVGTRDIATTYSSQQVTLDGFIPDAISQNISLVKIDVEGYEANCLRGMKKILNNKPTIFFECIDPTSGAEVEEILSAYGYKFHEVNDLTGSIDMVNKITPHYGDDNKIVMHRINRIASMSELL